MKNKTPFTRRTNERPDDGSFVFQRLATWHGRVDRILTTAASGTSTTMLPQVMLLNYVHTYSEMEPLHCVMAQRTKSELLVRRKREREGERGNSPNKVKRIGRRQVYAM